MKTKIVPASELSPKTLRAKDYVLSPVRIVIVETVETSYLVHLDVDTSDQAQSMLEEMDDVMDFLIKQGAKKKGVRATDRYVASAVVEDK